jgi:hypothetical protein
MNQYAATGSDGDSRSIVQAFRFLDGIGEQIEALIKEIKSQIITWADASEYNISKFRDDAVESKSQWLFRSSIHAFEIRKQGVRKNQKPSLYGAFQVSLALENEAADEFFFPHVAVLLAALDRNSDWEQWVCEEFQLDSGFLSDAERQDGDAWVMCDGTDDAWESTNGYPVAAFVVPLVALHDEQDVNERIVRRLARETNRLLTRPGS